MILRRILCGIALFAACVAAPQQLYAAIMHFEAAQVTLQNTAATPSLTSINFLQPFSVQPLVFSLATTEGSQPSAVRIRNVTTTGFEIVQTEPANLDGGHVPMTTAYFAIEPGITELPGGTIFEAGWIDTTTTVQKTPVFPSAGGFENVGFATDFGAAVPAVLAEIQTMNNEASSPSVPSAPSTPWLTASVRNVTATGAQLSLGRAEVNDNADGDGDPANDVALDERLAYVAIASGSGTFTLDDGTDIFYDAFQTADVITGWGAGATIGFNQTFATAPLAVATIASRDGGDGGWLRRGNLTSTGVQLVVDEDQFADTERNHTAERASLLAFSEPFHMTGNNPEPETFALALVALLAFVTCVRRRR